VLGLSNNFRGGLNSCVFLTQLRNQIRYNILYENISACGGYLYIDSTYILVGVKLFSHQTLKVLKYCNICF